MIKYKMDNILVSISENIDDLHELSQNNRDIITRSNNVGCFYCLNIYPSNQVNYFIDCEKTGLCVYCHVDSLIGDSVVKSNLKDVLIRMKIKYFSTIIT